MTLTVAFCNRETLAKCGQVSVSLRQGTRGQLHKGREVAVSVHEVERFLFAVKSNPGLASSYRQDRVATVASWEGGLEPREIRLLETADFTGLYRHGVHPVLLASSAAALGVRAEEGRRQLKEAFGLDDAGRPLERGVS